MKTPINELLDWIIKENYSVDVKLLTKLKELRKKETQHIINSYTKDRCKNLEYFNIQPSIEKEYKNAFKYYKETFE